MIEFPPLHPMLVHFPVALLPVSVGFDALAYFTKRESLSHAAWWTMLAAAVASPLTAISGWIWLDDMDGMSGQMIWIHKWLGTILPVLLIGLAGWRYRAHVRGVRSPVPYLIIASMVLGAMIVQGHLGATMTFGESNRHDEPPTARPATTQAAPADDGWRDSIRVEDHHHD